jgi:photosystem II stability/assembly factor-like uncharacterized protein
MTWSTDYPTYGTSGDGSPYSGSFDGVDDSVETGISLADAGSGVTTIALWFKGDSVDKQRLISAHNDGNNDLILLRENGNALQTQVRDSDGNIVSLASSSDPFGDSSWHHTAVVVDNNNNNLYLYLDGSLIDSNTATGWTGSFSNPNINIGAYLTSTQDYYSGNIDDVAIYDRALSSSEVSEIYNYGVEGFVDEGGNISFISQSPSDLDILNGFDDNLRISYNYTNNVSEWSEIRPDGDNDYNWTFLESDNDGSNLISGVFKGRLYLSTDSGSSWSETRPDGDNDYNWSEASIDNDGSHIMVGGYNGRLYLSNDSGSSWSETRPAGDNSYYWTSISMDDDGSTIIVSDQDYIYLSTDSGSSWTNITPGSENGWESSTMDSDGSHIMVVANSFVYKTTNSGVSWTNNTAPIDWYTVDSNFDGSRVVAGEYFGRVYITYDFASSGWTENNPNGFIDRSWDRVSIDDSGSNIIIGSFEEGLYYSTDGGDIWSETRPDNKDSEYWSVATVTGDGNNLYAGAYGDRLYIRDYSTALLNFSVNSTVLDCVSIVNGSCIIATNTTYNISPSSYIDGIINYTIEADNFLYPGTYNLPEDDFEYYTPSTYVANSQGKGVLLEHQNLSLNSEVEFLEFYANQTITGTSDLRAYYCNSSYSTGKPQDSDSCTLLQEITSSTNYSHCHTSSSCHYLVPIKTASSNLVNGEVELTATSYFPIIRTIGTGEWTFYYKDTVVREGASKTTTNTGNTYSNLAGTFDSHVHFFSGNETLYYQAIGVYDGNTTSSSEQSDIIDLNAIIPNSVTIYSPIEGQEVYDTLLINYSNVSFYDDSGYYNISLLNSDLSFNSTIIGNNSINTTYQWLVYNENLTIGNYFIRVEAIDDVNNLSSISRSGNWSLESNAIINLTANDNISDTLISNFTGWYYNYNTTENITYTADGTNKVIGVINGDSYLVSATKTGDYTTEYANITVNASSLDYQFQLFTFNSIRINIYNFSSMNLLEQEVTIKSYYDDVSFENSTSTGTIVIDYLTPEFYELRFSSDGFNTRSYFLTVNNDSTTSIDVYMVENTSTELVTVEVVDTSNQPVSDAVVILQKEIINDTDSFITVQESITSYDGKTYVWIEKDFDVYYRFAVDYEGVPVRLQPSNNYVTGKKSFLPSFDETVQLIINIEDETTDYITPGLSIRTDLNITSDFTATYTFRDSSDSIQSGKLVVYGKYTNSSLDYSLISEEEVNGTTGVITYDYPIVNGSTYLIKGYVKNSDGVYELHEEKTKVFDGDQVVDKQFGLLITFLLIIITALLTIELGVLMSAIISFSVAGVFTTLWFVNVPVAIVTSFIALAFIVLFKPKRGER